MAKPSGITTGDGTETHPWEVHNYEEIKWACEDAEAIPEGQTATSDYVYINLVNDIDCQEYDVDFTWGITCLHSIYLDLCQHTIETFYVVGSGYMFRSNVAGGYYIGNGKILNVYGYWDGGSEGIFNLVTPAGHTVVIENISFSIDMSKLSTIYYVNGTGVTLYTIKNCSFWIQGDRREAQGVQRALLPFSGMISCCDFYLNDLKTINNGIVSGYSDIYSTVLTNCRFQGNYLEKITTSRGTQYIFMYAILRNCVFDLGIDREGTGTSTFYFNNNTSTSNTGIYNSEKIGTTLQGISAGYTPCLTSEMDRRVNPNADNILRDEKHFDVITG